MRINHPDAPALLNILQNEITQQRGLSRTCLTDHIYVLAAGRNANAKRDVAAPLMPVPDVYPFVMFHPSKPLFREERSPRVVFATREMATYVWSESPW